MYMYMYMRRCDARLQAVPNPYYRFIGNLGLSYTLVVLEINRKSWVLIVFGN